MDAHWQIIYIRNEISLAKQFYFFGVLSLESQGKGWVQRAKGRAMVDERITNT